MVLPLKSWSTVFNAITATTTARVPDLGAEHPEHANSILLEIVGASTPDWSLAIQGRASPNGTYLALDYVQIWTAGASALSNGALVVNDTTRRFYVIPNAPPQVQIVATRTTGTLTVYAGYTSEVFSQWLLTTARGSIFIEGPTASDAAEAGNPVQIGGSVDETSPASAGEGDVRRFRSTPEGNVIAEIRLNDTAHHIADDAAFTVGTTPVAPMGALADETSPDSVDEGDIGAPAMTLSRELYVRSSRRGAGDTLATFLRSATDSSVRVTVLTPTSGKKVRVIMVILTSTSATAARIETYFSTGGSITTTASKAIALAWLDGDGPQSNAIIIFPDGAGPVGAVDDVVSWRTGADLATAADITLIYKEE